jgi:hypothetical protein
MPVEYLDSANFSKAVAFLVALEASKAGDLGRRKVPAGAIEAS